jgi:hypothetical protein
MDSGYCPLLHRGVLILLGFVCLFCGLPGLIMEILFPAKGAASDLLLRFPLFILVLSLDS